MESRIGHDRMNNDLDNRIHSLVAEVRGELPRNLTPDTRLAEDLGMDGLDAVEFFEKFQAMFQVDLTAMRWDRHFGGEGCNPFAVFLPSFWRSRRKHGSVTIRDLVASARAGKWIYDYEKKPTANGRCAPQDLPANRD